MAHVSSLPGGWRPIDANGLPIRAITAGFVLYASLFQQPDFGPDKIVSVGQQIVAGTNYRFHLRDSRGRTGHGTVFVSLDGRNYQITSADAPS